MKDKIRKFQILNFFKTSYRCILSRVRVTKKNTAPRPLKVVLLPLAGAESIFDTVVERCFKGLKKWRSKSVSWAHIKAQQRLHLLNFQTCLSFCYWFVCRKEKKNFAQNLACNFLFVFLKIYRRDHCWFNQYHLYF
jgi:hypothetical protein